MPTTAQEESANDDPEHGMAMQQQQQNIHEPKRSEHDDTQVPSTMDETNPGTLNSPLDCQNQRLALHTASEEADGAATLEMRRNTNDENDNDAVAVVGPIQGDANATSIGQGSTSTSQLQLPQQRQNSSSFRRSSVTPTMRTARTDAALQEVAIQSALYPIAYFGTHAWAFCNYIFYMTKHTSWFSMLLLNLTWPLQGFCNMFIFMRPRLKRIRERHPEWSRRQVWQRALKGGR